MGELKQNNFSLWLAIIGVAVFAIGSVSIAAGSAIVNNYYGNTNVDQTSSDSATFSGTTFENETFNNDVDVKGDLTVSGSILGSASLEMALDFTVATGTGSVALPNTQALIGSVQNSSGEDLICTYSLADITATGLYGVEITGGVATTATSTAGVIASNYVATSTDEIVQQATPGTAFDFASGSYFTITRTTAAANATSSSSFTTAGGMVGSGIAYLGCTRK